MLVLAEKPEKNRVGYRLDKEGSPLCWKRLLGLLSGGSEAKRMIECVREGKPLLPESRVLIFLGALRG